MAINDQGSSDMKAAMKAKEPARLSALRLVRAELLKAEEETRELLETIKPC